MTYADYTASGRSLAFIEDFIREHVMPLYANTHTESSGTGLQTTRFREDARTIIHRAVGGNDDDVVIFCGSGATGAIIKLIDIMNLRVPKDLDARFRLTDHIPVEQRPVVFIGPFEHHSNELPWRESVADVVVIDEDENGRPDLKLLEAALTKYASRPLKIGSFSAASNVTGIGAETRAISALLHHHSALACWDFAAAAPYVRIDMNHTDGDTDDYKDAIFLSPHKFIGGPGTPGVLVVKRAL
ncbi:MAG: aminotransferase class V-fold PLP-dependent enzyme [Polyangiales bacterium]